MTREIKNISGTLLLGGLLVLGLYFNAATEILVLNLSIVFSYIMICVRPNEFLNSSHIERTSLWLFSGLILINFTEYPEFAFGLLAMNLGSSFLERIEKTIGPLVLLSMPLIFLLLGQNDFQIYSLILPVISMLYLAKFIEDKVRLNIEKILVMAICIAGFKFNLNLEEILGLTAVSLLYFAYTGSSYLLIAPLCILGSLLVDLDPLLGLFIVILSVMGSFGLLLSYGILCLILLTNVNPNFSIAASVLFSLSVIGSKISKEKPSIEFLIPSISAFVLLNKFPINLSNESLTYLIPQLSMMLILLGFKFKWKKLREYNFSFLKKSVEEISYSFEWLKFSNSIEKKVVNSSNEKLTRSLFYYSYAFITCSVVLWFYLK